MAKVAKINYEKLEKILGYTFKDKKLLRQALTHRSVEGADNNERLEFLGDGLANFVIADELFKKFPHIDEGRLTRLRSSLIKKEAMADIGRNLKLSDFLQLGPGELKSGGVNRDSIIENTFEAIVGAIYIDSNFQECRDLVLYWYDDKLKDLKWDEEKLKDPKSLLQEYLQRKNLALPEYILLETKEPRNDSEHLLFIVSCKVKSLGFSVETSGVSIKKAEQKAAEEILKIINNK